MALPKSITFTERQSSAATVKVFASSFILNTFQNNLKEPNHENNKYIPFLTQQALSIHGNDGIHSKLDSTNLCQKTVTITYIQH